MNMLISIMQHRECEKRFYSGSRRESNATSDKRHCVSERFHDALTFTSQHNADTGVKFHFAT